MTYGLTLNSGRGVRLESLRQYGTYRGLLEGLPTIENNQRMIEGLLKERSHGAPPLLIRAVEKLIELPPGRKYPFGTPSALPSVTCIIRLESHLPTVGGEGDESGLTVIWFQEDFSFPPTSEIEAQIKAIQWDDLAGNFRN